VNPIGTSVENYIHIGDFKYNRVDEKERLGVNRYQVYVFVRIKEKRKEERRGDSTFVLRHPILK